MLTLPVNTVCNEQPTRLQPMSPKSTRALNGNGSFTEDDRVRPISERPPSLKPLDLGEMSLMDRMTLHVRRKSSTNLLWSPKRISIGKPTDFRKLDYTDKQRRSLKPLQLEPVVLKGHEDEMLSDGVKLAHSVLSSSDADADAVNRHSYRSARDTPWQRCQQMSASARLESSLSLEQNETTATRGTARAPSSVKPALSTQSSSSSIRDLRRQTMDTTASVIPPSAPRNSMERIRLHRKRSNQSTRMSLADSKDLEQEILELNTIVEERSRADASRGKSYEDLHVPAVAPRMGLRARSETLTDIGSAFSRPLRLDTDCEDAEAAVSPFKSPAKSRLSRPFTNMPDPNLAVQEVGVVRRPSSRVTGWLSNILSTSSAPTNDTTSHSLYSVRPYRVSESSQCSTVTELESPSLTAASSPISKGHSRDRSLVSPPSTACTSEFDARSTRRKSPGHWGPVDQSSQVGLAL